MKQIGLGTEDGSVTRIKTTLPGVGAGAALGGGSDLNGDGLDDLVIGAPGVNAGAGGAWLMLGWAAASPSAARGSSP